MKKTIIISLVALFGSMSFQANAQTVRDSLEFDKAVSSTPAELLRGQVAGVRVSAIDNAVNGALNVNIRGINELRGDSQPLWIVNGVQLNTSLNRNIKAFWQFGESGYTAPQNPLAFLNPYDIESIEVIKDLSAAAIYGAAGANGVVVIKTKMPVSVEKLFVWDSNVSVNTPTVANDAFTTSISHNHSLGVSGTANNTTYSISGYYRDVNGIVANTGNVYAGLNVNFETKANSVVWFGLNSISSLGSLRSTTGTAYFGAPSMMLSARNPLLFPSDTVQGWASDYDDDGTDYRTVNSVYLTLNFTPWLSLKTSVGVDLQNYNRYIWYGNGTSFGLSENGAASVLSSSMFNYSASSVLSANRYIGRNNHIKASLGVEVQGEINKFNTMNGTDFFSHELRGKGISIMASKPYIHKFRQTYIREAAFASLSYDWKGIVGANASVRADFTPKYYDSTPVIYPAGSAWADIHKAFLPDFEAVSTLKLKAGYGKAGRERFVPYGLFGEYCSGDYFAVAPEQEAFYEGLNHVESTEFTASAEVGFMGGRILLSAGYYDKVTEDALNMYCFGRKYTNTIIWHYVPRTDVMGVSSSIANRGIEGSADFKIIDNRRVKWSASANATYNVNQVIGFDAADTYGKMIGDGFYANINALGWQLGSNYGYLTNPDGSLVDVTRDGKISEADKEILGSPVPKYFGAFGTTLSAFGLTLDVLVDGAADFTIFNLNRLVEEGVKPYVITDKWVERGDFVRLSRVSLGYDIPFKARWIRSLRVNLSACNLLTLTGYSGWSPDVNSYGISNLSCGLDYGSYPVPRSFVLGISAKF
ncbi:MAG: TonB-dependent receptor plug domain-containing protein [Bacteroidales bacterium]|nr:TonB-dependent receptor plug domain-containing protein [Bacteroidales bacterium]